MNAGNEKIVLDSDENLQKALSFWKEKSKIKIDYFSLFTARWISFETWLIIKYQNQGSSGARINKIKTNINKNLIYNSFSSFVQGDGKVNIEFRRNLSGLIVFLNKKKIEDEEGKKTLLLPDLSVINQYGGVEVMYREYLEVAYQVRNLIFHGKLTNQEKTSYLFEVLYLTFHAVTGDI